VVQQQVGQHGSLGRPAQHDRTSVVYDVEGAEKIETHGSRLLRFPKSISTVARAPVEHASYRPTLTMELSAATRGWR
jgi:hypothetical protein